VWRFEFPDIDDSGEKMPNLMMIEAYMRGTRLPPPDLWLSTFRWNCYYSLQHYAAALIGRVLGVGPGVSYHMAYCILAGLIALVMGSSVARFCKVSMGRWIGILSLLVGGSGTALFAHVLLMSPHSIDSVRFVGGAIVHQFVNPLGQHIAAWMAKPGLVARDLPMEPLSYILTNGDYHPPLSGFLLLGLATALMAAQATGADGSRRAVNHALLAATVPISFISNAWIFPLQLLLVAGWFGYRIISGEGRCWVAGLAGAAAAAALEFPYLADFARQAIGNHVALRWTGPEDHTPLLGWLMVFWPVVGIMILSLFNSERRSLTLFFVVIWTLELAATEFFYNKDLFTGVWSRFNSTLKWWPWVYAGVVVTLGACNLGARSRVCRYGTMLLLLPTLVFGVDLAGDFVRLPKSAAGQWAGSAWIERDPVMREMIAELGRRPDGVALESGLVLTNTESPAVLLFSGKQSLLGWPNHEITWRGKLPEISDRLVQITAFYRGTLLDPLRWLLSNDVKYVVWLPRDNEVGDERFQQIFRKIGPRFSWHRLYSEAGNPAVGYWERNDDPFAR
jgi:uncharacterized membrane protein